MDMPEEVRLPPPRRAPRTPAGAVSRCRTQRRPIGGLLAAGGDMLAKTWVLAVVGPSGAKSHGCELWLLGRYSSRVSLQQITTCHFEV